MKILTSHEAIDVERVILYRFPDGSVQIEIEAELCGECRERVRYFNTDGVGNAACGCTVEGPEACDPIPMKPTVRRLLLDAIAEIDKK